MNTEERTPFGRRLFNARVAAGYTQEGAAKAAGMSQSTLAEAEISGKRSGFTPQLAALYGVSAQWLATGKEKKPVEKLAAGESEVLARLKPKSRRDKDIAAIIERLHAMNDIGLAIVLDKAKDVAREYPVTAKKTAS